MSKKSTRQMICEIADFAKKTPWTKYQRARLLKSGKIAYCAMGYCDEYLNRNNLYYNSERLLDKIQSKLSRALRKLHPESRGMVVAFNDAPTTRKRDIIALFEEACKS